VTNTAAHPGPLDPTADCAPDEPYFPLVGRDPDAPAAIRHWCDTRRARLVKDLIARKQPSDERMAEIHDDLRRCTEAETIADAMVRWRRGHKDEPAPLPARENYSGVVHDEALTSETDRRKQVASAVQSLREAAYYISTAQELLGASGELAPGEREMLEGALDAVNFVAGAHEPKRPTFAPAQAGEMAGA